uniref:Uncharacterized protein n=1 Tax=Pseudonaja textilis TaxID=8673 RepID=A0A670YYZ2_PSETE
MSGELVAGNPGKPAAHLGFWWHFFSCSGLAAGEAAVKPGKWVAGRPGKPPAHLAPLLLLWMPNSESTTSTASSVGATSLGKLSDEQRQLLDSIEINCYNSLAVQEVSFGGFGPRVFLDHSNSYIQGTSYKLSVNAVNMYIVVGIFYHHNRLKIRSLKLFSVSLCE